MITLLVLMPPQGHAADIRAVLQAAVEDLQSARYDEGLEKLYQVAEVMPGQAVIHNLMGYAYMQKEGFTKSALAEFNEALRLDPQFGEAYFNLGTVYASQFNDAELAIEHFEKAIEVDPSFSRAYFALGWLMLIDREDPHRAAELFEKSVEETPDFPEAYYGLGLSYLRQMKRELALTPISRLRILQREDLAAKLESLMQTGDVNVLEEPNYDEEEGTGMVS